MKSLLLISMIAASAAYKSSVAPVAHHHEPHKAGHCNIKYEYHSGKGGMSDWWGWRCLYDGFGGFGYDTREMAEEQAAKHVLSKLAGMGG